MNKQDKQKEKQERLARALRDNLRRRKQQPLKEKEPPAEGAAPLPATTEKPDKE